MSKYVQMLGAVSPSARGGRRAYDILAALTPPPKPEPSAALTKKENPTTAVKRVASELVPSVLAGAVGATFWGDHRVLGFLLGMAVGDSAYDLYKGNHTKALCQIGVGAAGVAGSLYAQSKYRRSTAAAVGGWLAGEAVGAAVTAFVPGSPMKSVLSKLKAA